MNRKIGLIALLAIMLAIIGYSVSTVKEAHTISYSQFQAGIVSNQYASVEIKGAEATVKTKKNEVFVVVLPSTSAQENVSRQLSEQKIAHTFADSSNKKASGDGPLALAIFGLIGMGIAITVLLSRITGAAGGGGMGGGGGMLQRGASLARLQKDVKTRLTDVAGIDEVRAEVAEIIDFLKAPQNYERLGAKIPRGVLMSGPPGTGKTLLARAIAGEAKVPFYTTSGSEFVEMFVGVGAKRVREMFETAKKHAPCIVFIDEIDAVARQRGGSHGNSNDEREQTLNQLLVEMDGFEQNGVIVIAATNRPDILDEAMGRRFTRKIEVALPDVKGRQAILENCSKSRAVDATVDFGVVAKSTPGFSGAELEILVNEAALIAARNNATYVTMEHIESARDKAIMGLERKTVMSREELLNTAYHEAGHAVVGHILKLDPIHKISIVPRGRALGVTVSLPDEDKYSSKRSELKGRIAMLYGGRVAEELFSADITTGASNDYERATDLAYLFVSRFGMSELGHMVVGPRDHNNAYAPTRQSQETQREVDLVVRNLLNEQYDLAKSIIIEHTDKMHKIVELLMAIETINREQFEAIMNGDA